MNWPEIEAIIYSEDDNPHKLLGPHLITNQVVGHTTCIQAFYPDACAMELLLSDRTTPVTMEMADEAGYFAAMISDMQHEPYKIRAYFKSGEIKEYYDAYFFEPQITRRETDLFQRGLHYQIYEYLGAHPKTVHGVKGVSFAVWAPNVLRVSVVGDFNQWDGRIHQMRRLWSSGVFEIFIPGADIGDCYKFECKVKGGLTYLKSDPYGFGAQMRPETASVIREINQYQWNDDLWMTQRFHSSTQPKPISVFELHLGSFAKPTDDREFYQYRED